MAQTIRSRIEAITKKLRKYGQEHLVQFVDQLDRPGKMELLEEIDRLDLDLMADLVKGYECNEAQIAFPEEILPPTVYLAEPTEELKGKYERAMGRGQCLIAEHKVAAFTVAGGQGTRLNFDGPKGDVPATVLRNKTLFRVFAESIIATERRYNCTVPWYIMTSPANHDDTLGSFEENNYYGLDPKNIMHFPQGMMPCVDTSGKILMNSTSTIARSPDGHGGSLRAVYTSGAIEDMLRRGIEYISYFQIDNPLVMVIDPLFIGLHAQDGAEMSSKAVVKCDPFEKVGNFANVDGNVTVIEYSDLPEAVARQKCQDGRLMFEYGSIAIHVISRSFVERLNNHGFSLPWHHASKCIPHIDENGNFVEPDEPNGIKFESFVFDALPLAAKSVILEIDRAEQFAPIKNASGTDSLQTSLELQIARAARWLEQAGVKVPRRDDGSPDLVVEISPLFALDSHELEHKRAQLGQLKSGDYVYLG